MCEWNSMTRCKKENTKWSRRTEFREEAHFTRDASCQFNARNAYRFCVAECTLVWASVQGILDYQKRRLKQHIPRLVSRPISVGIELLPNLLKPIISDSDDVRVKWVSLGTHTWKETETLFKLTESCKAKDISRDGASMLIFSTIKFLWSKIETKLLIQCNTLFAATTTRTQVREKANRWRQRPKQGISGSSEHLCEFNGLLDDEIHFDTRLFACTY